MKKTTIVVYKDTWESLTLLKLKYGCKTIDSMLKILIQKENLHNVSEQI